MYLKGQRFMRVIGLLLVTLICPLAVAEAVTSDSFDNNKAKLVAGADKAPHIFSLASAEELNDEASALASESDKESARMLIFLLGSLALSLIILSRDRGTEPK